MLVRLPNQFNKKQQYLAMELEQISKYRIAHSHERTLILVGCIGLLGVVLKFVGDTNFLTCMLIDIFLVGIAWATNIAVCSYSFVIYSFFCYIECVEQKEFKTDGFSSIWLSAIRNGSGNTVKSATSAFFWISLGLTSFVAFYVVGDILYHAPEIQVIGEQVCSGKRDGSRPWVSENLEKIVNVKKKLGAKKKISPHLLSPFARTGNHSRGEEASPISVNACGIFGTVMAIELVMFWWFRMVVYIVKNLTHEKLIGKTEEALSAEVDEPVGEVKCEAVPAVDPVDLWRGWLNQ